MNFPHKDLEWTALDESDDVAAQVADHHALLAHAIARQASSQSARSFDTASQGLPGLKSAVHPSFMENRMTFFSGRVRPDMNGRKEAILFKTGCFRPDLAQRGMNEMHG